MSRAAAGCVPGRHVAVETGRRGEMRLGVLGDIHGYLPGSDRMCIDFAVNLTATLAVDAFLQVGVTLVE